MRAVKSVTIDSERRVIITFLDGSTETLYPNLICCDAEALRDIIKELLEEKADAIVQTINNVTVATFEDGADEALIRKLLVSIEPIQEGEGDPSPENVRPSTGRTGLTVYRSGSDTSNPTEFPVTWETEAGIVYSGTLDAISGKLTVDSACYVVTGSENISYNSTYGYFNVLTPLPNCIESVRGGRAGICSHYPVSNEITANTMYANYDALVTYANLVVTSTLGRWQIRDSRFTTVEEIKAYLSEQASGDNPVTLIYLLATPTEFQLTAQEITTLLGTNNIWADSGNILELEYVADTKLYIGESQSGTLGSGRQAISNTDIQPVSEKTLEDISEADKAETAEKETQEETEVERGE